MKLKLCITLFLITLAVTCLSMIVVLIPILVLPSLAEDRIDYDPIPATCILRDIELVENWKKCRVWHSCRQDCSTKSSKKCSRLYVDYQKGARNNKNFGRNNSSNPENETIPWTETGVPLLINPNSCGDLPEIDCMEFQSRYAIGETFPCYYSNSKHSSTRTVINYSWQDEVYPLFLSIGLPICLFLVFCIICSILCFWYCRGSPGYKNEKIDVETVRKCAFE